MLGVEPTASHDDIKSAFRAKAKQSHPDHGGSEEQFKQLNEAYDTLKDPHKRAAYDHNQTRMGSIHINVNGKQHDIFTDVFRDLGDVFGDTGPFSPTRSYHKQAKNKDLSITIQLTLAESLTCQNRMIKVKHLDNTHKMVKISVPAGTMPGDSIKYNGLGDSSISGVPPGSLVVHVKFTDIDKYEINGSTVNVNCTINAIDAIIGTSVTVYDVENKKYTVNVPKGTQHGTVMRIPQKGLVDKQSGLRGDLKVIVLTKIPTTLTEDQLNTLKRMRENEKE
jgi:curved DNA-binding protein